MESGPLSSPEFKEFAKTAVLFAHVTSRVPGEKYGNLLTEKGGQGFPYLVVLDAEGEIIGKPSGRSVDAFATCVKKADRFATLSAKGDLSTAEKVELLVAKIGLGKVDLAKAKTERDAIGKLGEDEAKQVADAIVDLEILDALKTAAPKTPEAAAALGKRYYEMHQSGARPQGDDAYQPFYMLMIRHAEAESNPAIFEVALKAMKEKYGHMKQAAAFFQDLDKKFAALQEKASKDSK